MNFDNAIPAPLIEQLRRHRELEQQIAAATDERDNLARSIHRQAEKIAPGVARIHGPIAVPDPAVGHWLLYVGIISTDIKVVSDVVPECIKE